MPSSPSMWKNTRVVTCVVLAACASGQAALAQQPGVASVVVDVHDDTGPVAGVDVQVGTVHQTTDASGRTTFALAPGRVDVIATKDGYDAGAAQVEARAGTQSRVEIELEPRSALEETIVVSATRSERRIEDEPIRVEVVPSEEVQEKIAMAPGDVSMLLAETNGLRVQPTSPSVGGATVRVQGLSGRYTQILADGLPLYGGQSGAVGVLQIPPMDLAQVEVIKGVASALYGMSAIGGVVNLVSRRPKAGTPEHEVLFNQTSHRGTDAALWLSRAITDHWSYSTLAGVHTQGRSDLDGDGWTDLPQFRRVQARTRLYWDNGNGKTLLATVGMMGERRRGGTMPGATLPDRSTRPEHLDTTRVDAGVFGRIALAGGRVLAVRASGATDHRERTLGAVRERDRTQTWFGETSLTGTRGRHTWVGGGALQHDAFTARDVPRFSYDYWTAGVFGQDDVAIARRLSISASGRVDHHNVFGTFVSPKVSALMRAGGGITMRVSGGRGHIAPTPFTEDTDATGLTPIAHTGGLLPEDATSVAGDVTWRRTPFDVTGTLFHSRIAHPLAFRESTDGLPPRLVNAERPTTAEGTEVIARYHEDDLDIILTHMYLWSTEQDPESRTLREVPLNPRQTASFDVLWEVGASQFGFEAFYTGRQALERDPYRDLGRDYLLWGLLATHRVGPALLYLNTENLGDVRQTRWAPLVRPRPLTDGRWTTDAWSPIDGRSINAGLRFRF